jgi:hypothetical protein
MGRPEEIATVALFLASGEASFVNGVELSVGGGFSPSESAVTKSRLVPADRARSGTWPCHARPVEVNPKGPRSRDLGGSGRITRHSEIGRCARNVDCQRRFWSPCGVQTARTGVLASIWRPNCVGLSLVFSVTDIRNVMIFVAWGARGPEFKSRQPDQIQISLSQFLKLNHN